MTARVVRLAFRSLNMLDPAEVRRDMKGPAALVKRLRAALGAERRAVVVLGAKTFSLVVAALVAVNDALARDRGGLVLVAAPRDLTFLDMLGVELERFASVEQALAAKGWTRAGKDVEVVYEVLD
jgi:hypothetical protein